MKIRTRAFPAAVVLSLGAVVLASCITGTQLTTYPAEPSAIGGNYSLLLYGCHYPDQIDNVAILVSESARYPLEIFDLDTSYKTIKGVTVQQALKEADSFLRCTTHRIWQTALRSIPDGNGGTIGFEVRPLYVPYEFGQADVLLISYSLRNDRVRAYIRLDPDVKRIIESSGSNHTSGDK